MSAAKRRATISKGFIPIYRDVLPHIDEHFSECPDAFLVWMRALRIADSQRKTRKAGDPLQISIHQLEWGMDLGWTPRKLGRAVAWLCRSQEYKGRKGPPYFVQIRRGAHGLPSVYQILKSNPINLRAEGGKGGATHTQHIRREGGKGGSILSMYLDTRKDLALSENAEPEPIELESVGTMDALSKILESRFQDSPEPFKSLTIKAAMRDPERYGFRVLESMPNGKEE